MVEVVSHCAQETMAAAHNPMRKQVLRLLEAVDTMAGDEVELAKHSESPELQNCTWCKQNQKKQTDKLFK
ncbi:hypothetical protein ACFX2I_036012 [Malus domestica]